MNHDDLRINCGELPVTPDKGVEKVTIQCGVALVLLTP